MSKSIAAYPTEQRRAVIQRRLAQNSRGNGYWAARAAADKLGIPVPASGPRKSRPPRKQQRDGDDQKPRKNVLRRKPAHSGNRPRLVKG
mgnify:CR=1 FL=1